MALHKNKLLFIFAGSILLVVTVIDGNGKKRLLLAQGTFRIIASSSPSSHSRSPTKTRHFAENDGFQTGEFSWIGMLNDLPRQRAYNNREG